MRSMNTAPLDGTRILIRTKTYAYRRGNYVVSGDAWVEAFWDAGYLKNYPKRGLGAWQEWCGNKGTRSTSHIDPIGWAPRPSDELETE